MDFGYKYIRNKNIFYNIPPQKPVAIQTSDLFKAIKTYYSNTLSIKKRNGPNDMGDWPEYKFSITRTNIKKEDRLFEIYPFMGLNTKNYTCDELDKMLEKYFGDFDKNDSPQKRKRMLYEKMGEFDGNLDADEDLEIEGTQNNGRQHTNNRQKNDKNNCKNIFAGIKLYPPLGFEPWPNNSEERTKVELLYDTCIKKNIPVITHCSTGGFLVENNYKAFSDPSNQWAEVLSYYPNLKINFAHFGSGDNAWEKAIVKHIFNGDNRVYTDFSCNTKKDLYYKGLSEVLKEGNNEKLENRVLFGSDFMIHLIWLESYNEYFEDFINTTHLSDDLKKRFASDNAEQFLFG